MEILKIGMDAYKIAVTQEELSDYELDYTGLNRETAETLLLLEDMLNQISCIYHKEYTLDHMLVEFFPAESGGCYTYLALSKPRMKTDFAGRQNYICLQSRKQVEAFIRNNELISKEVEVFCMENRYYLRIPQTRQQLLFSGAEWGELEQLDERAEALLKEYSIGIDAFQIEKTADN